MMSLVLSDASSCLDPFPESGLTPNRCTGMNLHPKKVHPGIYVSREDFSPPAAFALCVSRADSSLAQSGS